MDATIVILLTISTNGETERNGVWFPEDGDSCLKNRTDRQIE